MKSSFHHRYSSPRGLWQAQRSGFVMLIISVLAIGYISLMNGQQGGREYRRLSETIVPVTAALEELRFSAQGMIASVSEFGMVSRLEGLEGMEKGAAMVTEVHKFNRSVEAFNHAMVDHRKLASRIHTLDGVEIERIFHEGNRLKQQARELLAAIRDQADSRELFVLKEALERTEQQFVELVAKRLEYQDQAMNGSYAVIAGALERQLWVLILGSLFLVGLALLQRRRSERICRSCAARPKPRADGTEGPAPQAS